MFHTPCRWSNKFDIFGFEKVFFPINIMDSHWVLVIALMQQKRILYRDAVGGNGQKYTKAIMMRYLGDKMFAQLGVVMTQERKRNKPNGTCIYLSAASTSF